MQWKVQLEGHATGLEKLAESFDEDPKIFKENEEYYLWSSKFKNIDRSADIQNRGENIVRIVRHLGELDSLRVEDLEASRVVEIQEDGSERSIVHLSATGSITTTASARASVNGEKLSPKAQITYDHTQLALKDPTVRELIELRDKGDHWVNLYRIYEYIQGNIKSEHNTVEQGWWSGSEKERFTQTANSPEAIGHEARHTGDKGSDPPSDPMDHAKAKSLINNLINGWLSHRNETL